MRGFSCAAACAAATVFLATPAAALPMMATYSGYVDTSFSTMPIFGVDAGEDLLVGLPATLVFTYVVPPPGEGGREMEATDGGFYWVFRDEIEAGFDSDAPSPHASAVLTIGGHSLDIPTDLGSVSSYASSWWDEPQFNMLYHTAGQVTIDGDLVILEGAYGRFRWSDERTPLTLEGPFHGIGTSEWSSQAAYEVMWCLLDDEDECEMQEAVRVSFTPTELRIQVIPLPATLPLLGVALVLVAGLRRGSRGAIA